MINVLEKEVIFVSERPSCMIEGLKFNMHIFRTRDKREYDLLMTSGFYGKTFGKEDEFAIPEEKTTTEITQTDLKAAFANMTKEEREAFLNVFKEEETANTDNIDIEKVTIAEVEAIKDGNVLKALAYKFGFKGKSLSKDAALEFIKETIIARA